MNFIIWLIVGGIVGWLASIVMRTNGRQGLLLNIRRDVDEILESIDELKYYRECFIRL